MTYFNKSVLVIFLGIIIYLASAKFLDTINGKFAVNILYVKVCGEDNQNTFHLNINAKKYNRTNIGIDSTINLTENFDDKFQFEVELRIWGDGGWKRNFVHIKRNNACSFLYMLLGPIWEKIVLAAGANKGCPVRPGNYGFQDYNLDLTKCKLVFQTGRYFVILKVLKSNKVYECVEGEGTIV